LGLLGAMKLLLQSLAEQGRYDERDFIRRR